MNMPKDIPGLVQYLEKKFNGIDDRFGKVAGRFDAIDERFDTVDQRFDTVDVRFEAVDAQFKEVKKDIGNLNTRVNEMYDGLDAYAKKADTYFQEHLMLGGKIDRQEKWIHKVAKKVGVKLDY